MGYFFNLLEQPPIFFFLVVYSDTMEIQRACFVEARDWLEARDAVAALRPDMDGLKTTYMPWPGEPVPTSFLNRPLLQNEWTAIIAEAEWIMTSRNRVAGSE